MTDSRQVYRTVTDEGKSLGVSCEFRNWLTFTAEIAPILQEVNRDSGENSRQHESQGFFAKISALTHEPLTDLSRALLVIAIFFLLLSSIFIGLLAGAQHKLDTEDGRHAPGTTVIVTATTTAVVTQTLPSVPAPTSPPEEVRVSMRYSRSIWA